MLSVVEIVGVIVAVCLMAVGLWPGPWRLNTGTEPGDNDRINAIKEAIDILQQELADLEADRARGTHGTAGARLDDAAARSGESSAGRPAAT